MSAANLASLNNNKAAQAPAKTGGGQSELAATATVSPIATKAVAVTPAAIMATPTRLGTGITPPATAIVIRDGVTVNKAGK